MDELPNRIREHRKAKGWSLERLAAAVGVSVAHVSEIERGLIQLTQDFMRRYALALGVKPGDLLLETEVEASLTADERAWLDVYRNADPATREKLAAMATLIAPPDEARRVA